MSNFCAAIYKLGSWLRGFPIKWPEDRVSPTFRVRVWLRETKTLSSNKKCRVRVYRSVGGSLGFFLFCSITYLNANHIMFADNTFPFMDWYVLSSLVQFLMKRPSSTCHFHSAQMRMLHHWQKFSLAWPDSRVALQYTPCTRAAACDVQGVWLPLILMLQSCKFLKVILEAQVTQICSMDILRLTIKNVQSLVLMHGVLWCILKDQTLDMFIKSTIWSNTFIVQIWATKIDIKNWHLHSNRNNFRPHPLQPLYSFDKWHHTVWLYPGFHNVTSLVLTIIHSQPHIAYHLLACGHWNFIAISLFSCFRLHHGFHRLIICSICVPLFPGPSSLTLWQCMGRIKWG